MFRDLSKEITWTVVLQVADCGKTKDYDCFVILRDGRRFKGEFTYLFPPPGTWLCEHFRDYPQHWEQLSISSAD
jgi:hypothetical protein